MTKKLLFSAAVAAALLTTGVSVYAQTGSDPTAGPRAVGSTLEVHITDRGKALVRGARITGINGSDISASTSWGASVLNWTVKTNSSTELVRRFGGNTTVGEMKVGDYISFSGMLDTTSSGLVVNASAVKNWSIQRARADFEGTITSIASTTQRFTLATNNRGNITVIVNSSTTITKGSSNATFADLRVNDKVEKTSGLYNNQTRELEASTVKIKVNERLLERRNFEGTLKSIASTTAPTTMLVTVGSKDYTVNIPTGISILNKNWGSVALSAFQVGHTIRIYGGVQVNNTSVIDATVIRNTSI